MHFFFTTVHHSFVASFDFIVRRIKKENYAKKLCENAFLLKNKPLKTGSILEIIRGKNHSNYSSLSLYTFRIEPVFSTLEKFDT